MKILLPQAIFLSDLAPMIPSLRHHLSAYPDATIDVVVMKGMEDRLVSHPAVSSVLGHDKLREEKGWLGVWKLAKGLIREGYSLAIILPGLVRTALAVFLAGIPRRIGTDHSSWLLLFAQRVRFRQELKSLPYARPVLLPKQICRASRGRGSLVSLLFTDVVSLDFEYDTIQRHLQLLSLLSIEIEESLLRPRLFTSVADQKRVDEFLSGKARASLIAVAPASVRDTKWWPLDWYKSLVCGLIHGGCTVLLIGGQEDTESCGSLAQHFPADIVMSACGHFNPLQCAEMLKKCRVLVRNASAPVLGDRGMIASADLVTGAGIL
jgi:heptosyltransferase-2